MNGLNDPEYKSLSDLWLKCSCRCAGNCVRNWDKLLLEVEEYGR